MDPVSKARNASEQTEKRRGFQPGNTFGRRFKKGESANPGGRPKKKPLTEIYEEILADPNTRESVKQQIIQTMTSKGMAGVLERREAAERTEGKVSQSVELSGSVMLEQVLEARKRAGK